MQEIFNYTIDDVKYLCYTENNKVKFVKVKNNNVDSNLNEEELKQMISIYMFLYNNQKNSMRIEDIKLADTTFEVYYNSSNDLFTFKQIDHLENRAYLPILNKVFNTRDYTLYSRNGSLGKAIKLSLVIGAAVMTVDVSAFLNNNSLPVTFKEYEDFENGYKVSSVLREEIETYDNVEYNWEDIKSVIDNNPNLTQKEKEFLYGIRYQLEDNLEFIDTAIVKRNLEELKFEYKPYDKEKEEKEEEKEKKENKKKKIFVGGGYTTMGSNRNTIVFYGSKQYPSIDFESVCIAAAEHEVGHALTKYSLGYSYPGFFGDLKNTQYYYEGKRFDRIAEGVNEIFSREYANNPILVIRTNGYDYLMPAIYTLCEILDTDVLRCYKYNCNLYYITNALYKQGIPLEDIHGFYNAINIYGETLSDKDEKNDVLTIPAAREVYNYLDEFYYLIRGTHIKDNIALSAAFYNSDFVDEAYNSDLEHQLEAYDFTYYPRMYFNTERIKENPVPYIMGVNEFGHFTEIKLYDTYEPEKEVVK